MEQVEHLIIMDHQVQVVRVKTMVEVVQVHIDIHLQDHMLTVIMTGKVVLEVL